jgi:hypothetical protein
VKRSAPLRSDPEKTRAWQQRSAITAAKRARTKPRKAIATSSPLRSRKPVNKRNPKRSAKNRLEQHGTRARTRWFNLQPCACKGKHPECTGGQSEPSHVKSRGAGGKADSIIPQSHGCHRYVHQKGWRRWQAETGVNARALADRLATEGPDAPRRPKETTDR